MNPFHEITDRHNTFSIKWDKAAQFLSFDAELPLWVADADFQSPKEVVAAMIKRAEHGVFGYTSEDDLRFHESVIRWYKKTQNLFVLPEQIAFTPGVVAGINTCIQAFSAPGDSIVIQPPVYHPFAHGIQNNKREVLENTLIHSEEGYQIDFAQLENLLALPQTTMMIFCNPHNPIGKVWSLDEIRKIGLLCLQHNVLLVSDEIHSSLTVFENVHTPLWNACPEIKEQSILFTAPSKTFNVAGLQLAHGFFASKSLKEKFALQLDINGIGHPNCFAVEATISSYEYGLPWLLEFRSHLESQFILLDRLLKEHLPLSSFHLPQATYLAWVNFSAYGTAEEVDNKIKTLAKVAFNEGSAFGATGKGYQRINVATSSKILEEAILRIKDALLK